MEVPFENSPTPKREKPDFQCDVDSGHAWVHFSGDNELVLNDYMVTEQTDSYVIVTGTDEDGTQCEVLMIKDGNQLEVTKITRGENTLYEVPKH